MNALSGGQSVAGTLLEGKYRLERELGVGGMGQVFLARHEQIDRDVAIKVLHQNLAADEDVRRRFETEAKAIARLRHPNCVMLYEFGFSREIDALFAVFEYVEGHSLEKWVGQQVAVDRVVEIGRQVAEGIEHAHSQQIIHRDLKPDNIMVVFAADGSIEAKVLDFGIARIAGDEKSTRLTQQGQMFGTPPYMSPEQIKAKLDVTHATDIYSIGIILYELLEGRLPFIAETPIETVMMHLNEEVPPMVREAVPEELRQIVLRCLEKDPADRFPSCKQLARALEAIEVAPSSAGGMRQREADKETEAEPKVSTDLGFGAEVAVIGDGSEEVATAKTLISGSAEMEQGELEASAESQEAVLAPEKTQRDISEFEEARIDTLIPQDGRNKRIALIIAVMVAFLGLGALAVVVMSGSEPATQSPERAEAEAVVAEDEAETDEAEQPSAPPVEDEAEVVLEREEDEGREEATPVAAEEGDREEGDREAAGGRESERLEAETSARGASAGRSESGGARQAVTGRPQNHQEAREVVGEGEESEGIQAPTGLTLDRRRRTRENDEEESVDEAPEQPAGLRLPGRN